MFNINHPESTLWFGASFLLCCAVTYLILRGWDYKASHLPAISTNLHHKSYSGIYGKYKVSILSWNDIYEKSLKVRCFPSCWWSRLSVQSHSPHTTMWTVWTQSKKKIQKEDPERKTGNNTFILFSCLLTSIMSIRRIVKSLFYIQESLIMFKKKSFFRDP